MSALVYHPIFSVANAPVAPGDLREGGPDRHPDHRQEEVSRALGALSRHLDPSFTADDVRCNLIGPDGRPVRLRDPEANQARAGEGDLHLRRRGPPTDCGAHELDLRRAQVRTYSSHAMLWRLTQYVVRQRRGWLPLRELQRREHVRVGGMCDISMRDRILSCLSLYLALGSIRMLMYFNPRSASMSGDHT